jgi:hypothetical protein
MVSLHLKTAQAFMHRYHRHSLPTVGRKFAWGAVNGQGQLVGRAVCGRPVARHLDNLLLAINEVQPSYIRVEADEATYNLHIILLFELEQALVAGDLQAADVPAAWDEKFRQLFARTPPGQARGCLRDIHWSGGGIGCFPTYTPGSLYAARFMEQARRDLGDLDADFRRGEFGRLKGWLNEKVRRPGQRYRPAELCRRAIGRPPWLPANRVVSREPLSPQGQAGEKHEYNATFFRSIWLSTPGNRKATPSQLQHRVRPHIQRVLGHQNCHTHRSQD